MAFGSSPGPPATARQVQELLSLLHELGHADFRDARGPMGFTQRQAAGKFTRDEAEALIEQLQDAIHAADTGDGAGDGARGGAAPAVAAGAPPVRPSKAEQALREASDELLAAELQRRGWIVVEP